MKVFKNIMKVLAALAAIAGVVYVIATYGDRIVQWTKNLLRKYGCVDAGYEEDEDLFEEESAPAAVSQEADTKEPDAVQDEDFED